MINNQHTTKPNHYYYNLNFKTSYHQLSSQPKTHNTKNYRVSNIFLILGHRWGGSMKITTTFTNLILKVKNRLTDIEDY